MNDERKFMVMAHESLPLKRQILCKQMCSHVKDAGMFYRLLKRREYLDILG